MAKLFNYISLGNTDWLEEQNPTFSLSIGRLFEYTPKDVSDALEHLELGSISYLKTLPSFLCSEVHFKDDFPSMNIRLGVVKSIVVSEKEVSASFVTGLDLGEVSFETVEEIHEVFGTDKFQIYRTHWAVRNGSTSEILTRLLDSSASLSEQFVEAIKALLALGSPEVPAAPPAQKGKENATADSVEAFLRLLFEKSPVAGEETFYRGHEDASYELTPSLLRKCQDGAWEFLEQEDRLNKELLIAHYDAFQVDQYCFDKLVRMQHYGLPTRLLDISGNPLVALFFACSGGTEAEEIEGEVIIFRIQSDRIKYYDSDTVSCLSNLSNLTFEQKNKIDLLKDLGSFNDTDVAKQLLHHIKSEKGYFEGRIVPDDLGSVICVKAKQTNSRIKSQSGAFLLYGHEAKLAETGQAGIEVARIRVQNKKKILEQLNSININATTVYPSIDQTTSHLRSRYKKVEKRP